VDPPRLSTATGLTSAEAGRRLAEHGRNALPEVAPPAMWRRVLAQLRSPLIYILLFALVVDLASWLHEGGSGVPLEGVVIALVLALNAGLGAYQEHRSEQALARLRSLAAPQARVVRDGALTVVPSAELVPGDLVRVESGDRIPADGTLAEAHGFLVDESLVTGESLPVDKAGGREVFSGTLAARGVALIEVTATGAASTMGRLATMLGTIELTRTPLERRLDDFGRRVARWIAALAVAVAAAGLAVEGIAHIGAVLLFAAALAVAAVPEGMPAVVTLTLALGVQRMARRNAVVRRLSSVEALGSVTVIATDKTGTLTENQLSVAAVDADDADQAVRAMVLASEADGAGDPMEAGLLAHARAAGVDVDALRARHPRRSVRPFDSAWSFMRVTVDGDGGAPVSYVKGAPEVVIGRAAIDDASRRAWSERAARLAAGGHRVLALARGDGEAEERLQLLGLVALWDPPRAEVSEAIRAAQDAGVRVVMITGDHPETAMAVARAVGLGGVDAGAVTGPELDAMTPAERLAVVASHGVFARMTPEHKLAIVDALVESGEIVAVTGDGVNDAPALKRADVGVAMGRRGSDVTREVADLVLLDDNFASIVAAIDEGRGIYANIQKFIRFMFSTNLAELLLVLGGTVGAALLGLRDAGGAVLLPLTAVQLLWINFITDGPPALALGVDRNRGLLGAPPHPPSSGLLDRASIVFVLATGLFKGAVAGGLLLVLPMLGVGLGETAATVFLYTAAAQLAFTYPARRNGTRPLANRWLDVAVVGGVALQLAAVLLEPIRAALGLAAPGGFALTIGILAVAGTWAGAELIGGWTRRHHFADELQERVV